MLTSSSAWRDEDNHSQLSIWGSTLSRVLWGVSDAKDQIWSPCIEALADSQPQLFYINLQGMDWVGQLDGS